jgi:hypothetical protein
MLLTLLLFGCWQAFASSPGAWPRRSGPFFRYWCRRRRPAGGGLGFAQALQPATRTRAFGVAQ